MKPLISPLFVTATGMVNAAGRGKAATLKAMREGVSGLKSTRSTGQDFDSLNFDTWIGIVDGVNSVEIEKELSGYRCRNNQLAKMALDSDGFRDAVILAKEKYGGARIGVFMGTSTSGIAETEKAYQHRDSETGALPASFDFMHTQNIASVQDYVQHSLGLNGPGLTISTACSSSAKVFATAHRYISLGLCDAAVVGGVDSLCLMTLYGFNSLQLVSPEPCRPWDKDRQGINIGEAAGFALLEKSAEGNAVKLKGYGESSDAYHMSTPHPEGEGAVLAIEASLQKAGLTTKEIDYINLHGTATLSNDKAEAAGLSRVFENMPACSSTKGITGHTLGAAGITEAIICSLVLENGILPANVNLQNQDPSLQVNVLKSSEQRDVNNVMTNSFGFGGSNCSLVFGW